MGYYASGGGCIDFEGMLSQKQKDTILKILNDAWYDGEFYTGKRNSNHDQIDIWMDGDGKYYYETGEALAAIAEIARIQDGGLDFTGEDGTHWRFVYDREKQMFVEESGEVVYETDKKLTWETASEFIGQIIDGFEDFLESKGVTIDNPEKEQSESPAILYGTDYGELQSYIEDALIRWDLLPGNK